MRKLLSILLLLSLASIQKAEAQDFLRGFNIPQNKKSSEVPFSYQNGFIIVEIIVQDAFPLKFILDTGAEYTILAEKAIGDLLNFKYHRSFEIMGSDLDNPLVAYLARNIKFTMGRMQARNEDILVLAENVFQFETFAGTRIHGILGANAFKNLVVQIDYRRERLVFHDSRRFTQKSKGYTEVPIDIQRNKPFLEANFMAGIGAGDENVRLLLDTGANVPFLLRKDSVALSRRMDELLPGNIASGIGGDLYGFVGRSHFLEIDEFEFSGVITNYQLVRPDIEYPEFLDDRNGIIGNPILDRFDLILDYVDEKLYLKPNRNYKSKFKYDRSGLQLIAGGSSLSSFSIYDVLPNSPAARAGLKEGDEIIAINGISTKFMNLAGITFRLQGKAGKRIRMKIKRNGAILKKSFRLEDLI